jgi:hypothetical protein
MTPEVALGLVGTRLKAAGHSLHTPSWLTLKKLVRAQQPTNKQSKQLCRSCDRLFTCGDEHYMREKCDSYKAMA